MNGGAGKSGLFGRGLKAYWVPAVLLAAAAALALDPLPFRSPVSSPREVPAWATDTTPVRQASDRPEYRLAVYTYRCMDCHRIIPSSTERTLVPTQHGEIRLEHGINARCLNCHHPENRDAFVADGGYEIPWNEPYRLCAKCHGPVYRDWQHGAHGRTNGYWDQSRGEQARLRCIDCHDPHHPTFAPLRPAAGPDTLRMGPQEFGPRHEMHDPLRLGTAFRSSVGRED